MSGLGETKEEAIGQLRSNLEKYRRDNGSLPRPGENVPLNLTFASDEKIEAHRPTIDRIIGEVINADQGSPVFLSDQSSLWDFAGENGIDAYLEQIKEVFGVDVSDMESGNLATIAERIDGST
jgi:hypothetical protein